MRFSKPVMVVPEPPWWSTIAVITQLSSLGFVPAYLPLLLSNLSLRPSLSSLSPFLPSPFLLLLSLSFRLAGLLLRFLPPFTSIRFPPRYSDRHPPPFLLLWSIINPSIPSRSFHPHIIRACTHSGSSAPTIPTTFVITRIVSSRLVLAEIAENAGIYS